jgi:VWFA-related protein
MQTGSPLFFTLVCATAFASSGPQATVIRADVNLVQLQAKVTDSEGHVVRGLGREAFQLSIDDAAQPITMFQGEDAPVTAGIVVDNSASMAPKRNDVVAAALAFARASNPKDQMFVVHFSDGARLGLPNGTPFTGDVAELEMAISRFQAAGITAMYDGILLAESQFIRAAYNRKVILVITDGGDNASQASLADVLNAAWKSETAIFAIGIFDEADRDRNPRLLTQLAEATGAEAFFPTEVSETRKICERIAGDIRNQYTLAFSGSQDGRYHRIKLTASDPRYGRLEVQTRAGYFALKP